MLTRNVNAVAFGLVLAACAAPEAPRSGATKKSGGATTDEDALEAGDFGSGGASKGKSKTPSTKSDGSCTKMDILFVLDDSGSMTEEHESMLAFFPKLLATIDSFDLDYRIGVTTSSRDLLTDPDTIEGQPIAGARYNGWNGELIGAESCKANHAWVAKDDPDVETTLSCMAKFATTSFERSSSIEMPLDAMKLALSARVADGKNAGFLRDDALLTVVVITDEDDNSLVKNRYKALEVFDKENLVSVESYVTFLDELKGGRGRWATAVIAGTSEAKCTSALGSADPAPRLVSFAKQAGKTGSVGSICSDALDLPLKEALTTFESACKEFPPPVVK